MLDEVENSNSLFKLESQVVDNSKSSKLKFYDRESLLEFPHECKLSTDSDAPLPVIYMSMGRSGSSVTWDTMARLMGDTNPPIAEEITGSIAEESDEFFNQVIPPDVRSNWAISYLCYLQRQQFPNAKMVGFQWKPFFNTFEHPLGDSSLRKIGDLTDTTPIRIIYVTRNVIDVRLSNMRHDVSEVNGTHLDAHCAKDDVQCIQEHKKTASISKEFISNCELYELMVAEKHRAEKVFKFLKNRNVQFIHVDYDNLYKNENNHEEWMRIFQFLGRGPQSGLVKEDIAKHFSMAKTSQAMKHYDVISNYEEVYDTLRGTEYIQYLDIPRGFSTHNKDIKKEDWETLCCGGKECDITTTDKTIKKEKKRKKRVNNQKKKLRGLGEPKKKRQNV